MKKNEVKCYNLIFPLWLLVWIPSPLWVVLIPLNYLADRFVLYFSLTGETDKKAFCRKNAWKVCLAGFLADLLGSAFLFACVWLAGDDYRLANAISYDPFSSFKAFLIIVFAVCLSSLLIYVFDRIILDRTELESAQVHRSALFLAIFTAPYLFLLPMKWFW